MEVSLVLVKPDGSQLPIDLKHDRSIIGRQTDCQIRIPTDAVSRRHCEISIADSVTAKDLGSANGTYLNRNPIQEAELHAGDVLSIGPAVFVVRVDGQPASIDAGKVLASAVESKKPAAKAGLKPLNLDALDDSPTPARDDLLGAEPDLDDSSEFDFDLNDDDAPKL